MLSLRRVAESSRRWMTQSSVKTPDVHGDVGAHKTWQTEKLPLILNMGCASRRQSTESLSCLPTIVRHSRTTGERAGVSVDSF